MMNSGKVKEAINTNYLFWLVKRNGLFFSVVSVLITEKVNSEPTKSAYPLLRVDDTLTCRVCLVYNIRPEK